MDRVKQGFSDFRESVKTVLAERRYQSIFLGVFALFFTLYIFTLPATYTGGIVGLVSLQYLTPELAFFSLVMSTETALIASFIAYSSTLSLGTELETSTGIAGSILPPLLCCSPLLPALGAVVASLTPLAINTGYLQGLIAVYETEILLGATLILGYSAIENSKAVRRCIS
ncbi:MAG: hypothetical protein ABEJ95_03075 [Candidatus Nanohalobium sp.]